MVRGTSYNENIRMHAGSNDYSSLVLGAVSGTSGTGTGQWTLVRFPSTSNYQFTIRYNSTDYFIIDYSGNFYNGGTWYDNANTGYYVKPSSTSNLYSATINSALTTASQGLLVGGADNNTGYGVVRWGNGADHYHGLVLRGYPNNTTTGYTASDQMSFFDYGGIFNFYQKNISVVTLLTRIDNSGNIVTTGNITAYGSPSDRKLKENIQPLQNTLNKILQLRGVTFDWREETDQYKIAGHKNDIGFIAQEVEKIIPEIVREKDGVLAIRERALFAYLVEAIKEQQNIIDSQEERLAKLEKLLNA
jgi:hypothetical protein